MFGKEQVFMDVGALEPGTDWREEITSKVGTADAFLVVIGRGWLTATNDDGDRRLDDPEDEVRTEIALALEHRTVVVIPVLVRNARMPSEDDLPPDIARLTDRHAIELAHTDWHAGHERLVATLRKIVQLPEPKPPEEPERSTEPEHRQPQPPLVPPIKPKPPSRPPVLATALGLAGAVGLVAGTWLLADLWAHPIRENENSVRGGGLGYFESVAAMTVVVGAVGSLLLSYGRGAARLATGLFLGFALAGFARYVSVLGVLANTEIESRYPESSSRFGPGAWIALAGCALLAAAALVRIWADREERDRGAFLFPRLLVLGGASLVVVATTVPYTSADLRAQAVLERTTDWYAIEPIGAAAFAVVVALFLAQGRIAASGALMALGGFLALLWASRYIAFPAWQVYDAGTIRLGGFLGLGGGLAILTGGLSARPRPAGYSVGVASAASSRR